MKTKLLTIFLLAMIFAFLVGCVFGEIEVIRDMNTSRGGFLPNGRRFIFSGSDQVVMKLEQFLEQLELSYLRSYDFIIQEEIVEEILERPEIEMLLDIGHFEPESMGIHVFYFSKSRDLVFIAYHEVYYVLYQPEGLNAIVINHESGAISHYYSSEICPVSKSLSRRNAEDSTVVS